MAHVLTAKEVENFNDAFLALDQDNSGEMEAEELAVVLQVLGLPGGVQEASSMIGQFDSDGSGSLDRKEFLTLMMNKGLSLGMEERAMIMAGPETRPLMARLQRHGLFLSEEQILKYREVFQILDADHSGEMDSTEGTKAKGREPVKHGNKLIENIGVMDNNNVYDQMLEKNGNVYDMENNGNNGNGYNSYMIGRIGGLLGKWRPTNMQLPTIPMARNGNGNTDNGANVDKDGNNCTNGNDNGGIGNNGNYCNDGRVSGRAGKAKQSLSVAELANVMKYLGMEMATPEVEKMVEEFDDDGSGLIEFEEFLVLMAKKRIKIYPSDLRVIKVMVSIDAEKK